VADPQPAPVDLHHVDGRVVSLDASRASLGRPSIWLTILLFEVVLALALAYFRWMSDATGNTYAPGSLLANLRANLRFDQRAGLAELGNATGQAGAVLGLISMLGGCFCSGGCLQAFLESTHGESVRRTFYGGARWFWRFVRLLPLKRALSGWIVYGTPWNYLVLHLGFDVAAADCGRLQTLDSEQTVVVPAFVQRALHALLFSLVMTWGDYTRTRLALHDTSAAVWGDLTSA